MSDHLHVQFAYKRGEDVHAFCGYVARELRRLLVEHPTAGTVWVVIVRHDRKTLDFAIDGVGARTAYLSVIARVIERRWEVQHEG